MMETFRSCTQTGADMLAIESTGRKEIHDAALLNCDTQAILFILEVMAVRDMKQLWTHIVQISEKNGSIPSGDTTCGFGNKAMILADKGYIPKVFVAR